MSMLVVVDGGAITDIWTRDFHFGGRPRSQRSQYPRTPKFARSQIPTRSVPPLPPLHARIPSSTKYPLAVSKYLQLHPDKPDPSFKRSTLRPPIKLLFHSGLALFLARLTPKPSKPNLTPTPQKLSYPPLICGIALGARCLENSAGQSPVLGLFLRHTGRDERLKASGAEEFELVVRRIAHGGSFCES